MKTQGYGIHSEKPWTEVEPELGGAWGRIYPLVPLLQVEDVLILHRQRGGVHFRQKDACWKDVMKHLQKMGIWDSR